VWVTHSTSHHRLLLLLLLQMCRYCQLARNNDVHLLVQQNNRDIEKLRMELEQLNQSLQGGQTSTRASVPRRRSLDTRIHLSRNVRRLNSGIQTRGQSTRHTVHRANEEAIFAFYETGTSYYFFHFVRLIILQRSIIKREFNFKYKKTKH
jgi:hypothetical protein